MAISVGTFNLNNLFSRYNFIGEVEADLEDDTTVDATVEYVFSDADTYRLRKYQGRLVKAKDKRATEAIRERIMRMDLDVLAVQEVEDVDTLNEFNKVHLAEKYPYRVLVEGNDPRLIDVGLLSRFPLGAVTSYQKARHRDQLGEEVFGRDLIEVEVLSLDRSQVLLTVLNTHLKSHYVPFDVDDPVLEAQRANERRARQASVIGDVIKRRFAAEQHFVLMGDMNDPPDSAFLTGFATGLGLVNGLADPAETRPAKPDTPPPASKSWTHRFKEAGKPADYQLFDHIWLSPSLSGKLTSATIDRRTKHSGDGSDHDPAWVVLDI